MSWGPVFLEKTSVLAIKTYYRRISQIPDLPPGVIVIRQAASSVSKHLGYVGHVSVYPPRGGRAIL
ncbi:hypothetical protein FRC05_004551, partial [Tulasnella sp. 425]